MAARKPPIPLTLVTGALGAGKTSLINRLIRDPLMTATAVILNETGEAALDAPLQEQAEDGIIALGGGCVCCTVRGALVDALERLLRALDNGRVAEMRRVIVEAAGLADPAPILLMLARHPYLSLRFHIDGLVTVVDAGTGTAFLDVHDEGLRQVATADRIVLTRQAPDGATALRARLHRLNPGEPVLSAGETHPADLAGVFDPPAELSGLRDWLAADRFEADGVDEPASDAGYVAFVLRREGAMSAAALYDFIDRLALEHGSRLLRIKGIIALSGEPEPVVVIHGVGGLFMPPLRLTRWLDEDRRVVLTVTGRDLDRRALEELLDACLGGLGIDQPDRAALFANPLAIPGFRAR